VAVAVEELTLIMVVALEEVLVLQELMVP